MSTHAVESSTVVAAVKSNRPAITAPAVPSGLRLAVLAPAAVAALALLAHKYLPNQQIGLPNRLYPMLLQALLGAALLFFVVQLVWRPLRDWAGQSGPLFGGSIFLLCLWDFITRKMAWLPLPYFPGPDMVLQALWADRALLLDSTYRSLTLLLTGYFAGVALGFTSGVLMGWFREVRYWGMPLMKVIGPIPATALVPLALLAFTDSFYSAVALIAWATWFPVTMLTTSGIANVPVSYLDVARTLGAGRAYLIFRVAIPAALPSVFIGLFMGLLVSFLALVVAETVGVKNGLGFYLKWQQGYAEYAKVFAALVIMAAFFSSLMTLLFRLRNWLLVWQKGVIRW